MSKKINVCAHCGREFTPNPRVKKQRYCPNKACQRARRAVWQRRKLAEDPDYQDNQRRCKKEWQERHPGYSRFYRNKRPEYVKRNRLLQAMRDVRRRKSPYSNRQRRMLAKMDSLLKPYYSRRGAVFKLVARRAGVLAKMDSLVVKLIPYKGLGGNAPEYACLQDRTR